MSLQFEIEPFWSREQAVVYREFRKFPKHLQVEVAKKIGKLQERTVQQAWHAKVLDKIRKRPVAVYELRIKTTIPVRMLGTMNTKVFVPARIFTKRREGSIPEREIKTAITRLQERGF